MQPLLGWLVLAGCAAGCAGGATREDSALGSGAPPASATEGEAAAPARRPYTHVEVRLTDDRGAPSIVQLVEPGVIAFAAFDPSGDDLYTYLYMFSDRRRGEEAVTESLCRARAKVFLNQLGGGDARAGVDEKACATDRAAIVRIDGQPKPQQADAWLVMEERADLDPPGFHLRMTEVENTELWVWNVVEASDAPLDPRLPPGFAMKAVDGGVGVPLVLPDP